MPTFVMGQRRAVEIRSVSGRALTAGELRQGREYEVNVLTGRLSPPMVPRPKKMPRRNYRPRDWAARRP